MPAAGRALRAEHGCGQTSSRSMQGTPAWHPRHTGPRQGRPDRSTMWPTLLACGSCGSTGPSSSKTPRTAASCQRSPGSSFSLRGRPRRRREPLGSTCGEAWRERGGERPATAL